MAVIVDGDGEVFLTLAFNHCENCEAEVVRDGGSVFCCRLPPNRLTSVNKQNSRPQVSKAWSSNFDFHNTGTTGLRRTL